MFGRIVRVIGLISKPELNGTLANVEGYNETTDRIIVRPISIDGAEKSLLSLKKCNIDLAKNNSFIDRNESAIPHLFDPPASEFKYLKKEPLSVVFEGEEGVIALMNRSEEENREYMSLVRSCALLGVKSNVGSDGKFLPKSVISTTVVVGFHEDGKDEILGDFEFEDLNFITTAGCNVICGQRANVIFRRCHFKSSECAVCAAKEREDLDINVTFENCVFANSVLVNGNLSITMMNCTINPAVGPGIQIRNGGSAMLNFCRIEVSTDQPAVTLTHKGHSLQMFGCVVSSSQCVGVEVCGGVSTLQRCKITRCRKVGLEVEGKSNQVLTAKQESAKYLSIRVCSSAINDVMSTWVFAVWAASTLHTVPCLLTPF